MAEVDTRYSDLCRLCAAKTSIVLGINIFEEEATLREVYKKIETCLPIQINQADDLPKMICENCLYKLDVLFDFRERTVRTENLLQDLFKEINANRLQKISIAELEHQVYVVNQVDSLNDHQLPNVSDLLTQREIVDQEIILTQNLPLDNIELSSQEFSQEISNHSMQGQDIILDEHMQNDRFTGIQFQEHQILTEQYSLSDINLDGNLDTHSHEKNELHPESEDVNEKMNLKQEDNNSSESGQLLIDEDKEKYLFKAEEPRLTSTDEYWVFCEKCGKSFKDKAEFQLHSYEHFSKCIECDLMFVNKDLLMMHRKESHGSRPSCRSDDSLEEAKIVESEEVKQQSGDKAGEVKGKQKKGVSSSPVCKECGKSFKTNYKLREHMRKHSGEHPYKCTNCDKAFKSKIGLAQHEANHTGLYDFSCITCGKGFQCRSYLMVHQRVHSDLKPFTCDTCGQGFKTKQSLLDHTNRHLGVKPYLCDVCGRGFITNAMCKAHQKIHTGQDNRKYSCKVCNKKFVSKSYLQTHIRIHTGEKPFICEVCGKGFLTRVDLKIHSTMHTGEKAYVCEVCGKAFARRDALRCHGRSHTGERPYSCNICGQTFTQYSPMAIHRRLHTGERPYKCEECGKRFVSRSTMVVHYKKHVTWAKQETPPSVEEVCQS